jgi:hypothetical protein
MLRFIVEFEDKEYGVVVRDDHPALIYPITRLGCRERWGDVMTAIYPFHSERVDTAVMADTVKAHLKSMATPSNVDNG